MRKNKWTGGKRTFVLPPLDRRLLEMTGLKPCPLVLDHRFDAEVVLLITELSNDVKVFRGREITGLWVKSGLANTSFGPVLWLLFYFPNPLVPEEQVTYENLVNLYDTEQVALFEELAQQEYWHLFIATTTGEVVHFFEFKNRYGLAEALESGRRVTQGLSMRDFSQAKAEFQREFSVDELLAM